MVCDTTTATTMYPNIYNSTYSGPVDNCTLPGRVCLRGGSEYEGNVYIGLGRGISKPVCDDSWDMKDGIVVCRELGYHGIVEVSVIHSF